MTGLLRFDDQQLRRNVESKKIRTENLHNCIGKKRQKRVDVNKL